MVRSIASPTAAPRRLRPSTDRCAMWLRAAATALNFFSFSRRHGSHDVRTWIVVFAFVCSVLISANAAPLEERLAPCLACHGEKGQSDNKEVPSLGAQPKDFVLIQLFMFRQKMRKVELMNDVAKDLSDDDL